MSVRIGESKVIESRESPDGTMIRRRRESLDGKVRFTTYERIERPALLVIKQGGKTELFDRHKLLLATKRSVGKFFKSELEIEDIVTRVEDELYALGEPEISSKQIGEVVLSELVRRSEVAYVRFASVFYEFKTLGEFEKILAEVRERKNNK